MLDYNPFWFGVLIGIGIVFLSLAIFFGVQIAYSEEGIIIENQPELKCLKFSDGRLAVISTTCIGSYETMSWFLLQGYKFGVYAETSCCYEVYMYR